MSDDKQVEEMVKQTVPTFGQLDFACNNAGVQNLQAEPADQTMEDFERVNNINYCGFWS